MHNNHKYTAKDLIEYAKSKNGAVFFEESYKNSRQKFLWQCSEGHQWMAEWAEINRGRWCRKCHLNTIRENILEIKKFAKSKNGILLSDEYINCDTPLMWQCSEGHQWKAKWTNVKNQHQWCQKCAGLSKPDILELQQHAVNKEGKLLSTKYINSKTKYLWQCKKGHIWEAMWGHIKNKNSWCPQCSSFKTEDLVRNILSEKLKIPLKKYTFIYNKHRYQFDGYNLEYKIAFEYHGYQHYIYPNYFHKNEESFLAGQKRDKEKETYCFENNIKLIIIPYIKNANQHTEEKYKKAIIKSIEKLNIII